MSAAAIATVAFELIKLGVSAHEAAQVGNEKGARILLQRARDHVDLANKAWEDAAQPGDDEG